MNDKVPVSNQMIWCASGDDRDGFAIQMDSKGFVEAFLVQLDAALDSADGSTESHSQLAQAGTAHCVRFKDGPPRALV